MRIRYLQRALICGKWQNEGPRIKDWCTFSVVAYKRKIVAFLVAVALVSGALVVCRAQSSTSEPMKSPFDNSGRMFASDPNFSVGSGGRVNTKEMFYKMMLSVLLVIVLGVTAIYVTKKLGGRVVRLPGRKIRIVETVHLGSRKAVHLLEAGNRRLLIGSSGESITMLADVTDALGGLSVSETDSD